LEPEASDPRVQFKLLKLSIQVPRRVLIEFVIQMIPLLDFLDEVCREIFFARAARCDVALSI
jgi:hypothetical protein